MASEHSISTVRVVTVTMSDTRKRSNDESGRVLVEELSSAERVKHIRHVILKEEPRFLQEFVRSVSTDNAAEAIVITGGTGITPRDVTYEALQAIFDKDIVGFGETFRRLSWEEIGAHAILSRASAGVVNECLVFSLPGSVRAVRLGVRQLILPLLHHAVDLAIGRSTHVHGSPPSGGTPSSGTPSVAAPSAGTPSVSPVSSGGRSSE
jgi:molybdenum cofactor biosynthesis protein B